MDSGRALLAQAKSLNDLVMLESEVANRESDLASLQAKKRRLADLTALSTITVVAARAGRRAGRRRRGPPGFLAGLKAGWNALLASLGVLLTVLGALLPWLVALRPAGLRRSGCSGATGGRPGHGAGLCRRAPCPPSARSGPATVAPSTPGRRHDKHRVTAR